MCNSWFRISSGESKPNNVISYVIKYFKWFYISNVIFMFGYIKGGFYICIFCEATLLIISAGPAGNDNSCDTSASACNFYLFFIFYKRRVIFTFNPIKPLMLYFLFGRNLNNNLYIL